jgi:hypothetical protein
MILRNDSVKSLVKAEQVEVAVRRKSGEERSMYLKLGAGYKTDLAPSRPEFGNSDQFHFRTSPGHGPPG